ncbi:MAG: hypothetical protein J7527_10180, partial [Chitinophagaceae bacterium]|nr:hypothetical protein [Chitinophagaceae bacterium]
MIRYFLSILLSGVFISAYSQNHVYPSKVSTPTEFINGLRALRNFRPPSDTTSSAADSNSIVTREGRLFIKQSNGSWKEAAAGGGSESSKDWVNVQDYGARDGQPSAFAFIAAIATGRDVMVPPGRYIIDTILTLPSRQSIRGTGPNCVLKTSATGAISPFSSIFSVIKVTNESIIENLRIVGSGKSGSYNPVSVWTTQNGVHVQGNANKILNCAFDSLGGSAIFGANATLTTYYNNIVMGNKMRSNTVGILNYTCAQYQLAVGNDIDSTTVGLVENGANNKFVGGSITWGGTGVLISGQGAGHGGVYSSSINHNTTAISLSGVQNGYTFSSVLIWYGNWSIDNSDQVQFNDCQIWHANAINPSGSSSIRSLTFTNCLIGGSTAIGQGSGTARVFQIGTTPVNRDYYAMVGRQFRMDSTQVIINSLISTPKDSVFQVNYANQSLLKVNAIDQITDIKRLRAGNLIADGLSNTSFVSGGLFRLQGGVPVHAFQQPFDFMKSYVNAGGNYVFRVYNDTLTGVGTPPDSANIDMVRVDWRKSGGDNIPRKKFAVAGDGSIWSERYPYDATPDSVAVITAGKVGSISVADLTALVGGGGGVTDLTPELTIAVSSFTIAEPSDHRDKTYIVSTLGSSVTVTAPT